MAFESSITSVGSKNTVDAVNTFTDGDNVERTCDIIQIAFGPMDSAPTLVTSGAGLPVSVGGAAAVVGNGAAATAQRVTIANDSTGIVALTTSTASIGKLASNAGVTIGAVELAASQTLATVTTVGTVTTCTTVTTVTTVGTLTGGGVAHDGADSGNPIKVGAKATAALSGETLVSAADRTDAVSDLDGAIITRPHATLGDVVSGNATNTDGTSTQCIAAAGANVKVYLTDVTICNTSVTAITVDIKDGTTVKWSFPVPAGGGVTHSFSTPIAGTANTAWNFDPSAAATTITCSMSGFKSKV